MACLGTPDSELGTGELARAARKASVSSRAPDLRCDILCAQREAISLERAGQERAAEKSSWRI